MEDLLNVVGNVGFPIAVAAYLLIRIEGKLNELSSAISGLREAIITMPQPWGTNGKAFTKVYPPV
jgi:hypothetical protein